MTGTDSLPALSGACTLECSADTRLYAGPIRQSENPRQPGAGRFGSSDLANSVRKDGIAPPISVLGA
jgi:hypothetical protein